MPRKPKVAKTPVEPPGLTVAQVCDRLGCSRAKVARLAEQGKLYSFIEDGNTYYDEEGVEALEGGEFASQKKKDHAFEQTVKALEKAHSHIEKFVSLTIDPVMHSNDALLAENQSLRAQVKELYTELHSVNELYARLQREQLQFEVEMEREKLNLEQRHEAMVLLKEQVLPAIVESMSTRKLISSMTDEQMEVLVASGVLTGEQDKLLTEQLKARRAKREREAAAAAKAKEEKEKAVEEAEEKEGKANGRKSAG